MDTCTNVGLLSGECRYKIYLPDGNDKAFHVKNCTYCKNSTIEYKYPSIVDIWNEQVDAYLHLLPKVGFGAVLVIRYEDLILRTLQTLNRIADAAGIHRIRSVTQVREYLAPCMQHGSFRVRANNWAKIVQHTYIKRYDPIELQGVCGILQRPLLERLRYEEDCDNVGDPHEL